MQIKFRELLIITFFGINLLVILLFSRFAYQTLKEASLERTKEQLISINILKKRHIEYYLTNKVDEIRDFLRYAERHGYDEQMLTSMLMDVADVVGVVVTKDGKTSSSGGTFETLVKNKRNRPIQDSIFIQLTSIDSEKSSLLQVMVRQKDMEVFVFFNKKGLIEIVLERSGMGATGESYFTNKELQMQSPSRFFPDSLPETIPVMTLGARLAFEGETGIDAYDDYRGVPIIGAYRLIEFHNLQLALLTEIDYAEAMESIIKLRNYILLATVLLVFINLIVSVVAARLITRPVFVLKNKSSSLSKGIIPEKFNQKSRIKEINEISSAINNLIHSLNHTIHFAKEIGKENFNIQYDPLSDEDELGKAVLEMRHKLILLNQQKSQLEIQRKKDLVYTQESERERISRDIHDGIGPLLTTTKMKVSTLQIDENTKKELIELINNTINEIRSVSRNLMPGVLIDFGPVEAIRSMVEELNKSTGFNISFHAEKSAEKTNMRKERGIALYRIAQEAINNALKHANATEIIVSLTEFDEFVSLYIKDNGKGFDKTIIQTAEGKGLRNIEERVNILGGDLYINSSERGTTIEIEIPRNEE